jgi:hypothetical protein
LYVDLYETSRTTFNRLEYNLLSINRSYHISNSSCPVPKETEFQVNYPQRKLIFLYFWVTPIFSFTLRLPSVRWDFTYALEFSNKTFVEVTLLLLFLKVYLKESLILISLVSSKKYTKISHKKILILTIHRSHTFNSKYVIIQHIIHSNGQKCLIIFIKISTKQFIFSRRMKHCWWNWCFLIVHHFKIEFILKIGKKNQISHLSLLALGLTLYGQGCRRASNAAHACGWMLLNKVLTNFDATVFGSDISQKSLVTSNKPGMKWFV